MKNILFYIILSILIFTITSKENLDNLVPKKERQHFCGADYFDFKINQPVNSRNQNNISKSRKLSTDYLPIRIFIDTTYLEQQVKDVNNMEDKLPTIKYALKKAVEGMGALLEVERFDIDVYAQLNTELLTNNSIHQWDEQLNNTQNMSLYYDYILFVRLEIESDGFPEGVLAAAMPLLLEKETNRPIVGLMMVTRNAEYFEKENVEKYFSNVFIHELTHAFGFLSGAFEYFPGGKDNTLGTKIDEYGITRYFIKTPKVVEFAKKYFGCDSIDGVEVENQGTGGSAGSHWEGRILLGEYMTSENYEDEVTISEFTLSLLEDSGWYKVNYYTGGLFRFGKNKGCEFLNKYCLQSYNNVDNQRIFYTLFNDEYFTPDLWFYSSCTTGRQSRAYNLFKLYEPSYLGYYTNLLPLDIRSQYYYLVGFLYSADFCPINYHQEEEYGNSYFIGNCKYGNGKYGNNLYYFNSSNIAERFHPNSELPEELGEKYSDNSFCMMTNLIPDNSDIKTKMYGTIFHPMCYPSFCSSSSLTVLIYDQYIVCPRAGGNIEVKGYTGKLHCPDYNLICTGTVVCNDLFDCIEKKSEPKDNTYTYDYTRVATQRYPDIENGYTYIGGELADDGVCPKNCVQCLENKKCKRCIDGYNLIGKKVNDDKPIICDNTIDITKGYYLKDNVYYLCHSNCEKCSEAPISDTEMNCDSCIEGLYYHENTKNCDNIREDEEEDTEEETEEDTEEETEEETEEDTEEETEEDTEEETEEDTEEEDSKDEEEEQNDDDNKNDKQEDTGENTYIIVIISVISALIIIIIVIVLYFYFKRNRIESDQINTVMNDNRETPLYNN